jgi:TRAP-type uncharacterized transport system substrate-binding protein
MAPASPARAEEPVRVTLGTAAVGGGFMMYGKTLAATGGETDPGLGIEPHSTAGSAENIPSLEAGRLDLALVLARPGLPEGIACRLSRALHRGEAAPASRLPQARDSTAAVADPALLHPGTRRYLEEIGALR